MSTLQDEMAALNHRLEYKLDTLRRLRRLHKAIGLFLFYVLICLALVVRWLFPQQQIIAILIPVMLPLTYCWLMFFVYRRQLKKGQDLKKILYSSFLNDEASRSTAIEYHDELEKINW
jgi:Flp pilus assembly protein TadB